MAYSLKEMARDLVNGTLQITPSEIADERMKVCKECLDFQPLVSRCSMCGCIMAAKTKMMQSACPAGKW